LTSIKRLPLSIAKIVFDNRRTAGTGNVLKTSLDTLHANLEKAAGDGMGYLALVRVRYRPCETKRSFFGEKYKTWGSSKTIEEIVFKSYENICQDQMHFMNFDTGYVGFWLPAEQEVFYKAIYDTEERIINGLE
jgi:hypothetical protein